MDSKLIFACFVCFFAYTYCFSFQNEELNSLSPTDKINALLDSISINSKRGKNDSLSLVLINKAMAISESLKLDSLRAEVILQKSNYHLDRQEKEEGLKLIFEYIKINEGLSSLTKVAQGYYKLAAYYYWNNEFERSLEYAGLSLSTIPNTKQNQKQIAKANMVVGTILQELDRLDESIKHHNKALKIKRELNLTSDLPISLSNIAHANLKLGDTILAISQFKESMSIADSLGLYKDVNFATFSLGCVYFEQGNHEESKESLEPVVKEWERLNSQKDLLRAYPILARTYTELSLFKQSSQTLNKFIELKDKAFDETQLGYQEELEKKYKTEKKELENLRLKVSNESYKTQVNVFGIGALIFSFLTILLGLFYYQMRKVKMKLADQNSIIENQNLQLTQLDELKSRFFANVSHELRTPLSLMQGPVSWLINNISIEKKKEHKILDLLQRNTLHLENLMTEILDLSKLENNKMKLSEAPISLGSYLNLHLKQFHSYCDSKMVNFKSDIDLSDDLNLMLDKNKFEKIINNLISNALKFSSKNDIITVTAQENNNQLYIIVEDSGRGIHPEDLPHIFDRFFQSNQKNAPTEGGTGIGLSYSIELVKLMNGKLWAESELGEGSKFHLVLPIVKSDLDNETIVVIDEEVETNIVVPESTELLPLSQMDKTILIVEDNADLREYLKIILDGYSVILKENGQEALDYLVGNPVPDLILSDLMMPILDGMQFLEYVKSTNRFRHIPFIMLTAKTNRQEKLKALRYGIDDYLTKPFDEDEIKVRIINLLSHSQERTSYSQIEDKNEKDEDNLSEFESNWLFECETFILENLSSHLLSVPMIATNFKMSESTFARHLKKLVGLSPGKYIQELKLNHAKLLIESNLHQTILSISTEVGFTDPTAFSRSFKKRFGRAPSDYKKK
ncbi:MAG: signal transduction histidine kinase/CheY-like chemotaxis protein [Saprospiraceae bacterium]